MESWKDYINSLDFELPETGTEQPIMESEVQTEVEEETKRVYVQKITTEVWIYSDLDKKELGNQTFQEIAVLGDMDFEAFAALINKRKQRRRRK